MLTCAAPGDEPELTALIEAAFSSYVRVLGRDRPGPYHWLSEAIADKRVHWIGAQQGAIVRSWSESEVTINQIAIDPVHQGKRLGKQAIETVENEARADGLDAIRLYTAQPQTNLVALYSSLGFQVTAVAPSPSGNDTVPRVFMTKPLR